MNFFTILFLVSIFSVPLYPAIIKVETSKGLHLALKEASTNGEDDTIELKDGYYNTSDDSIGTFKYSGIDGKNLTIKSSSNDSSKVSISGNDSYRALSLESNKTVAFEVSGVSISSGYSYYDGGGIYTNQKLTIKNSIILSNKATGSGGGVYGSEIEIYNSTITSNYSGYGTWQDQNGTGGGGIFATNLKIHNSVISQNRADYGSGGAIRCSELKSLNNKIYSNQTTGSYDGGAIYANSAIILNTLMYQNSSGKRGGAVYSLLFNVINSSFNLNSASNGGYGIYGRGYVANSYFYSATQDIYLTGTSTLKNNYIDYSKLVNLDNNSSQTIYMSNNIQRKSTDNFLDINYYIIDSNAPVVNTGLNVDTTEFKTALEKDLNSSSDREYVYSNLYVDLEGNNRLFGNTIDIGVYEYGATKYNFEPSIGEFSYSGTPKTGESITFYFSATAAKDRSIVSYYFDYGDGLFVPIESNMTTKIFNTEKEYTLRAKVTDDKGVSAVKSLKITIQKSCVCEVCKVCETCDYTQFNFKQSDVDPLASGWHLLGSSKEISIKSAIPNVQMVWVYLDGGWLLYESNSVSPEISTIPAKKGFWIKK